MVLAARPLSFTASELTTFDGCEARFYHEKQRYRAGLLSTDRVAADLGSAVHDALMELHRQLEGAYQQGQRSTAAEIKQRLRTLLDKHLVRRRLDRSIPEVAERLERLDGGIELLAELLRADLPRWAVDPARGEILVWVEAPLDHGPSILAVELASGYLVRTRPDLIGLRLLPSGGYRCLIRDYKCRRERVDPAYDTGILVRALWVLAELRRPRSRWFLVGRRLQVDPDVIDLETVNLFHCGSDEFIIQASLSARQLLAHRDRLTGRMRAMGETLDATSAAAVMASPGQLCRKWCPYLAKCEAGMDHVRKYSGDEALAARLGGFDA